MCDSKKASHPGLYAGVFFWGSATRAGALAARSRPCVCAYTRAMLRAPVFDLVSHASLDALPAAAARSASPGRTEGYFVAVQQRLHLILRKSLRFRC